MASAPLLSASNWMGANISRSRIIPSFCSANSPGPGADWTAETLSSSTLVAIIDFVFIGLLFIFAFRSQDFVFRSRYPAMAVFRVNRLFDFRPTDHPQPGVIPLNVFACAHG